MKKTDEDFLQVNNWISSDEFAEKIRKYVRLCNIHLDRLSIHADRIELVLSDDNSRVCNGWQRKEAVKRFRKIEKKLEKLLLDCEPKYGSTIIRRLTRNPIGTKCGWYVDLEKLADDIIYKGIEQIKHDGENK